MNLVHFTRNVWMCRMKLWVQGGQCDDYHECLPSLRCSECSLRFKCFTQRHFEVGELSHQEFCTFLKMCDLSRKCSSIGRVAAF